MELEPTDGHDELERRLGRWSKAIDAHYGTWLDEAREAFDLSAGRQWTTEEEAAMMGNAKVPVTFDRIGVMIDAISGYEIQTRQDTAFLPRTVEDSGVTDVISQGAKWVDDECDAEHEKSACFRDMLICGEGWTNTIVDPELESRMIVLKEDPLRVKADPSAKRSNYADARYIRHNMPMSRDEAEDFVQELGMSEEVADELEGDDMLGKRVTIVDPTIRYTHGLLGDIAPDAEVTITEWQWFEYERTHLVNDQGHAVVMEGAEFDAYISANPAADHVVTRAKRYYRAYCANDRVLTVKPILTNGFTYKAMTGKRDRNKRTYYGMVRSMKDPQRWSNKLYSQILDIMRKNASGGVMMEESAVDNIRNFEATWTSQDTTIVKDGALSSANGARIVPKVPPVYPQGMDRLMEVAVGSIRDTTGINQEFLGMAGRDQAGVLEHQRKQSVIGILAPFFDARTRYNKEQGRLLLAMMREYLNEGQLIRVVGEDGSPQYVPLMFDKESVEYDVIVDEAPTSPNQKSTIFQIMMQLLPVLSQADLPADFWAQFALYSPLPASMAQKLAKSLSDAEKAQGQEGQMQAQIQQMMLQIEMLQKQADTRKTNADAAKSEAETQRTATETQTGVADTFVDQANVDSQTRLNNAKTAQAMAQTIELMTGDRGNDE